MNLTVNRYSGSANYIKRQKNISDNIPQSNSVKFCATQDVLVKSTKAEVPKLIGQYADKLASRGENYRARNLLLRYMSEYPQLEDKCSALFDKDKELINQEGDITGFLVKSVGIGLDETDKSALKNMQQDVEKIKDKCAVRDYLLLCEKENILSNVREKIEEISKKMNETRDRFNDYRKNIKIDSNVDDLDKMLQEINPYNLTLRERLRYLDETAYIDVQIIQNLYKVELPFKRMFENAYRGYSGCTDEAYGCTNEE